MPPYQENLEQGLILRTVLDERDAERFASFSTIVNGASEGMACNCLLHHHPELNYDDYVLVEDNQTGEVVSTTCLIPWHCQFEGIPLDVAMLEMVVTHPAYRRRGLVRIQVNHFHRKVSERPFDLSIIYGIPYYYRQYGYSYAIDTRAKDILPIGKIPDLNPDTSRFFRLREVKADDATVLAGLYKDAMATLQFYTLRGPDYWRYLLEWTYFPVRIVEDQRDKRPVGYIALTRLPNNQGVQIIENSIPNQEVGFAVLQELKRETSGEIRLGWPHTNTLVQIGRSLGSIPSPGYQWLLRITDVAKFLSKIRSVLEKRIAESDFASLTTDLCINLFREAFLLRFDSGKIADVESVGFVDSSMGADGGDLCIPPDAFVRLVLGYRDLDELRDAWPDIVVKAKHRRLLQVLFPKINSYLCMAFNYNGPAS